MTSDRRCDPLIELGPGRVRAMLTPILGGAVLHKVARVEGGLVNTIYRVALDRGETIYGLRVYAAGYSAFEMERWLLPSLAGALPVPEVLYADASGQRCVHPYLVYRWIEGITLNECRRSTAPEVFLTLAEQLGGLLARIAGISSPNSLPVSRRIGRLPMIRIASRLDRAEERLRTGLARERLGDVLADSLRNCLNKGARLFSAPEHAGGLVHGDFGGRNILVKVMEGDEWVMSGLLDWEETAVGSPLWDVGSLFRYSRRYSRKFRKLFAIGYRTAGGHLPADWWCTARLLDSTRLVEVLNGERELPGVFAECRELIGSLIADFNRPAA